jgi:hypothetical protein
LTLIKDSFSALGTPCHVVVGNHDYQSATDRSAYERIFPEQINYSFTHRGWQIIGLDSSEGTKAKETRISTSTLTWLDQNLSKLDLHRPTILFTHFPLGDSVLARPLNADDLLQRCYGLNLQVIFLTCEFFCASHRTIRLRQCRQRADHAWRLSKKLATHPISSYCGRLFDRKK